MRVVFFGTPDFVSPVLQKLEEKFEVVEKIREPKQWNNLPAGKAGETIGELQGLNPDLFVVAAYGQILPDKLLAIPKLGAINIHPSLLPKYRGPSPIQSAILNGDAKTGVTFIKMDEELDHGPIIYQFEETILENDTFESLAKRLFEKSAKVLEHVIKLFTENQ
ncbi:MAG: methionyl-tRNA formyltransferase, partial [Candidatus Levybacteria bacterium]|nr:methionyl-tRNA formyltransferase [Candidatus Levybacteria bacterium]